VSSVSALAQPSDLVLMLTTVPDAETGERLARHLLEERVIACANLIPGLTSIYRWEGSVQSEPEVLMVIKTPRRVMEQAARRIAELHPYDVPEVVVVSVEAGLEAYCRWVTSETSGTHA
jgi:periplasmic divalent cation tolerance protein